MQVSDLNEFGNSWIVNGDECQSDALGLTDPCPEGSQALQEAQDVCFGLINRNGQSDSL